MLIDLMRVYPVLTPETALELVTRAKQHVLFGPEVLMVRTVTLSALRDARFRVLAEMPRSVRDRHKGE